MDEKKFSLSQSIWFWWFITTACYISLNLLGFPGETPTLLGYFAGFLGLFVPFGMLSLVLFLFPSGWISLILFIVLIIFADKKLKQFNLNFLQKVLLNIFVLLVITTIVDFVRGTPFMSWAILFQG